MGLRIILLDFLQYPNTKPKSLFNGGGLPDPLTPTPLLSKLIELLMRYLLPSLLLSLHTVSAISALRRGLRMVDRFVIVAQYCSMIYDGLPTLETLAVLKEANTRGH